MNIEKLNLDEFDDLCWRKVWNYFMNDYYYYQSNSCSLYKPLKDKDRHSSQIFFLITIYAEYLLPLARYFNIYIENINNEVYVQQPIVEKEAYLSSFRFCDLNRSITDSDVKNEVCEIYENSNYEKLPPMYVEAIECLHKQINLLHETNIAIQQHLRDEIDNYESNQETIRAYEHKRNRLNKFADTKRIIDNKFLAFGGFIYILTNSLSPGYVSIGCTARNPFKHVEELSLSFELSSPFVIRKYFRSEEPINILQKIFDSLSSFHDAKIHEGINTINSYAMPLSEASLVVKSFLKNS